MMVSKGLEFPVVAIPGGRLGTVATDAGEGAQVISETESQERRVASRVLYVVATRAMQRLVLVI